MKRLMTAVCCACVLGAAGLSAQADKKLDKMDTMDKGMKSMTVTGCVAEKDGHYMLNNAMMPGGTKAMSYGDSRCPPRPLSVFKTGQPGHRLCATLP